MLEIFTIYEHPADYPHCYVLRRFAIVPGQPEPIPDDDVMIIASDPDPLRECCAERGLFRLPRQPNDDPAILESWV